MRINDGNDISQIVSAFERIPSAESKIPTCIVAHTIKGKGVDFMENQVLWHAGKITDEQLQICIDNLQLEYNRRWSA